MPETPDSRLPTPDSTSRRDFLSTAIAATGALAFSACASGGDDGLGGPIPRARPGQPPRPGEPVRFGIIGTGGMGTEHARAFLRMVRDERTDARIAALCDICQPRLEKTSKIVDEGQGASVALHTDYRAMLADPTIHGVLIATPEHWHAQMAEDAIAAGKDVYVEKPMTLRLPQALRLREVARANPQVVVQVGTQYVMYPSYHAARRLIAEGAIGKPVWSQTSYCRNSKDGEWLYYDIDDAWQPGVNLDWDAWCGPAGKAPWNPEVYARWRRYRDWSTGIIGDLLVHRMAPLMMALDVGWPTRVIASGGHYVDKAMENHDQINITVEFEGEHTMVVAGSTANEVGLETMIRGHKANLYLGGRNLTMRPERLFAEEIAEQTVEGDDIGDTQDRLRLNWLECIRTRQAPASPVELGTRVMVAVDLATRSLWEGKAFGFDPERMVASAL